MILDFYKLKVQPFGVSPDPRYLYFSPTHREALASLYYGVAQGRGFLTLIAPPGMGKTTLLFHLLERLGKTAGTAFLFQTQCNSREFFRYLLADMGIDSDGNDLVQMHEALNAALIRHRCAGRRFVLVIDEAQNLPDSVLETVRLLSDFETPGAKLMQIILTGQPPLAAKLARPSLVQLRQRIGILSRLEPFSPAETDRYINHRLRVAGYDGGPLFTASARAMIAARSGGIPRNINNLCFNALSLGYALKCRTVDVEIIREVVADLDMESLAGEHRVAKPSFRPTFGYLPPMAPNRVYKGSFGARAFRIAALAALACLVSLFLFSAAANSIRNGNETVPSSAPTVVAPIRNAVGAAAPGPPSIAPAESLVESSQEDSEKALAVSAERGQTLGQICLRNPGTYCPKFVEQMGKLNPTVADPNHTEAEQRSVLPGRSQATTGTSAATLGKGELMTSVRNKP